MNSPFKVGDRVVIVKSDDPEHVGAITIVESELRPIQPWQAKAAGPLCSLQAGTLVHYLTYPAKKSDWVVACPPEWLRHYANDDREPIAWTDELERLCRGRVKA